MSYSAARVVLVTASVSQIAASNSSEADAPGPCVGDVGQFRLDRQTNTCLDIAGQKPVDGARVFIEYCNSQPSQNFIWCKDGRIVSAMDHNMCLDIPGDKPSESTDLQMWQCNGKAGQYWGYDVTNMAIFPSSVGESMCVDLDGGSTKTGTLVNIYSCSPGTGERWYAGQGPPPSPTPAPPAKCDGNPGYFQLNKDTTKCISIAGGQATSAAKLEIDSCDGSAYQKFTWCADGRIVSDMDENLCIDVPGGDPTQISYLQLWQCNGQKGQNWRYDQKQFAIYPASTNEKMCVDVAGGSTKVHSEVLLYTHSPGSCEQWLANPAGEEVVV